MLEWLVVDASAHPLIPVVRQLFLEYATELGIDLCFQGFEEELASLPGKYAPPSGLLLVILEDGSPIACGALRGLDEETGEIKRIYIRPAHRGKGLGKQITLELMDQARDIGYSKVKLDTLKSLTAAERLYRSLGFTEIPPYSYNPGLEIIYFERAL